MRSRLGQDPVSVPRSGTSWGLAEGAAAGFGNGLALMGSAVIGSLVTTAVYAGWAAWDAYQTTERLNSERAAFDQRPDR